MYTLQYKTVKNSATQEANFTSLVDLILQVEEDFKNCNMSSLDHLVSITYNQDEMIGLSAMYTLLSNLKHSVTGILKDEIKLKLDYMQASK